MKKIQRLSEQYDELKRFHEICNRQTVELTAKDAYTTFREITLSSFSTELIIVAVRKALLEQKAKLTEVIREEATK